MNLLVYRTQGQYAQAGPLYQRALAIKEKALGPEHPLVATSLNNLAAPYDDQGQYAQAEPLYQRALAILEKALGPEHPAEAASLENAAMLRKRPETLNFCDMRWPWSDSFFRPLNHQYSLLANQRKSA